MFYHESRLQYEIRVDAPIPFLATMLPQAIGALAVIEPLGQVPEREEPPYTYDQAPSREPQGVRAKAVETVEDALS